MSSPADRTQARKRPRQARSIALVEAVLDACEELLARDGYERLSTRDVADRAGVSVGSLYQYFPAKAALVGAVIERKLERDWAEIRGVQERLRGQSLEVVLEALVRAMIGFFARQAGLYAAMVAAMAEVARELDVQSSVDAGRLALEQALMSEPGPHRRGAHVAYILSTVLVATLRETARSAPHRLDDSAFADDMVRLLVGFLVEGR